MGKLTLQEIAKILTQKNGLTQREANQFAAEISLLFFNVFRRVNQ